MVCHPKAITAEVSLAETTSVVKARPSTLSRRLMRPLDPRRCGAEALAIVMELVRCEAIEAVIVIIRIGETCRIRR